MIDTHCHVLDLPAQAIQALRASGTLVIGASRNSVEFARLRESFPDAKWIRPAIGLHPELVGSLPTGELRRFEIALAQTSYVVEVGLDGSRGEASLLKAQRSTFERVLALCAGRKFVSVHARRAETEVLEVLEGYAHPVVFHWFTGSARVLDELLASEHLVAVNPAMLRSSRLRQLIAAVPRQQLVTESDAPFAARPERLVGALDDVHAFLAASWNTPGESVARQVAQNVRRLVGVEST